MNDSDIIDAITLDLILEDLEKDHSILDYIIDYEYPYNELGETDDSTRID